MNQSNQNTNYNEFLIDELENGMTTKGKYSYLQVIYSKNNNRALGQKFLMVTSDTFLLVRLLDVNLDFGNAQIVLQIQDLSTNELKPVILDVYDEKFKLILVSWEDIKHLMCCDNIDISKDDRLLDIEC